MNKKSKRILKLCIALAALISLAAELLYSNYSITVSRYAVKAGMAAPFRILFLSDLHGREFGKDNARLLEKIAGEEPDLIAFVGDVFDRDADEDQVGRMLELIAAAGEIAPVWFGMGNHEYGYMERTGDALAERIEAVGAVVVDGSWEDIELNGTPVRIGGYAGYYRTAHMNSADPERQEADERFFEEFEDTDRLKILLNHIPTNWLDWGYRDRFPVDIVLSGHYHGGVVRIPLIGQGLFAPYVGWFPPYTKGLFEGETATCVLTTGLSGSRGVPRVFNPPEIVTVDVLGK